MLLALNYSPQAAALLQEGRIQIDRFKTPDWPEMIAEARSLCAVAVHLNLQAGRGQPKPVDWDHIERILDETDTPYVNLHLESKLKDFPSLRVDVPETSQAGQIVQRMLEDVQAAVERFGAQRVIVENVHYRAGRGKTLRPSVEPPVMRRILDETECGLLLDISHARIAAHYLGVDERDYIEALPVERLRELHFTGLHHLDGDLVDHLEILESDWPVLAWALERIRSGAWARPWLLAFEYGGVGEVFAWRSEARVIAAQVPILHQLVQNV